MKCIKNFEIDLKLNVGSILLNMSVTYLFMAPLMKFLKWGSVMGVSGYCINMLTIFLNCVV